jgi:threonine 3-dehydrogenase
MKMDALVKKSPEKGLWLERVDVPVPAPGEALIKIRKTAICGTDVHIYNWDEWSQRTIPVPMIIGHEFVGEIVEINGPSDAFKVGDLVSAEGHIVCGGCRNCRGGARHLCPNTKGIGVNRPGIFGEYAVIPVSNLWLCDRSIPEDMYAIFDPFGNATHTALSFNLVGEDVLVTGAGPIGIMAAAIAKHVGARNVVLTNTSDWRLEFAKTVVPGIITVNTKNEDLRDVQKRLNMTEGFDVGLEMSGSGTALNQMVNNMINGGKIALLGLLPSGTTVNWDKVIFGCLQIKGIYGREMFETWQKMTAMLQSGLDISKIITHRLPYQQFNDGFELMNGKKCGKIILEWAK